MSASVKVAPNPNPAFAQAATNWAQPYPPPPPITQPKPAQKGRRYRKSQVLGAIFGGAIVLSGAYVGANWRLAEQVTPGTIVAGINIGGMQKAEAIATLNDSLLARSREPITLIAGDNSINIDPTSTGLSFDATKTVTNLTDFSLNPTRLIAHLRSEEHPEPLVLDINEAQLSNAARSAAAQLKADPVNGTVLFTDGRAVATAARYGLEVQQAEVQQAVLDGWLAHPGALTLTGTPIIPTISQAATDAAYTLARQVASGPVTIEIDGHRVAISAAELMAATTFKPNGGELIPQFKGSRLKGYIVEKADNLLRAPQNARMVFADGRPDIVAGATGLDLDENTVAAAVGVAATSDNRVAALELVETDPDVTAEQLTALGVNEVVASFGTTLTANAVRTNNLRRGAELINGIFLFPGDTFSLLDALSPITAANGFANAGVIVGGVHTQGMGGGLSQLATTAYNAGFFAGFEDIEHRPHSVFISRYPAGREATIVVGSLDMKFRNNTPYGAMIQSWVAGNEIHVAIWSTPYFRVETSQSARTNVRQATTVTSTAPGCTPQSPGAAGFTITNFRQVFRLDNGERVIDEANTWTYRPDNGIRCGGGGFGAGGGTNAGGANAGSGGNAGGGSAPAASPTPTPAPASPAPAQPEAPPADTTSDEDD